MDEDTDFIKLPLDERCTHKLWKARVHGYEEATKLFRKITEEKSSEWNKFLGLLKKFVADSNVAAQEKGLEATLAFIENAFVAGKTAGEIMPIIVTKCIGATKAKIKDLATQISLMYIEIEKQDIVLEELLRGTEQKNPKISAACVATITQALKEFGYKIIDVKSLLKKLPILLEDRDKNVRDEAKSLAIELFRWIGPVLKTHLSSLKPVQLQELEAEFDKVKDGKPTIQRFLRSQQAKQSKIAETAAEEEDGEDVPDNDEGAEVDPLELVEAVDILSKLPSDFYEKLEAKKWQERQEALVALEQLLTNAQKLENGDYGDLVRAIKKVITKDTNVMLVGIGCKCMAMLAKGLKKKFQPFAVNCLSALLEKFKEKKQNVVVPLRDAVDAIYDSTTLEAIQEDVVAAMESKNPAVKAETVSFIARCFTKCNSLMLNKKMLKIFTTALLKTLNESDPLVRDNSAEAIGTAWKVVGEKVISPFLTEVDNIKIGKIKEASERAVITAKPPKIVKKAAAPADVPAEKPKGGSVNPKPVVRKPVNKNATFVKKSSSSTSLNQKRAPSASVRPKSIINGVEDDVAANENDDGRYPDVQDLVARVDISSKITPSLVDELMHKDWKVRTEAVNKLQSIIVEAKYITSNLGEAVPAINERLTDSNGRLAATSVALCESIAVAMGPSCKTYIRDFFPSMLQGLGDSKSYLRSAAIKCINTWANTTGYRDFFEGEMIATALKSGSPTLRAELWSWLAERLPEMKNVPKDELMACLPYLYNNLEDRNSEVRKNANDAVLGFMMHLNYQTMFQSCERLKPVSVNNIKGVLDKARGNLPDIPVVSSKPTSKQATYTSGSAGSQTLTKSKSATLVKPKTQNKAPVIAKKKADEDVDSTPLLKVNNLKMQRTIDENKLKVLKWNFTTPREEFVEQLKEQMNAAGVNKTLITNMFHQNFKLHLKAIDALSEDVMNNTAALISNLDLILKWLTLRFFDTNPSVILRGLEYLNMVFRILAEEGYHMMETEAASFLPYLVLKTGDPKDVVRNLVRDIFDAIGAVYPISKLFNFIMDGVKSKNARQRTGCLEQLSRLMENYGLSVCQPTPAAALKEIAKQISDRDNSVRNAALNCVVVAYFITGDRVRQMIGQISDKDMSLLDERIKRASKTRPPVAMVKPTICSPIKRPPQIDSSPPQINNNTYSCNSEDEMPTDEDVYPDEEVEAVPPQAISANVSPLNETQNSTRRKHFSLDLQVMEAIESASIVHPKPNLIDYDKKYLEEKVTPIQRSNHPVSSNYAYNTQTIVKSRASPPKTNSLDAWIELIGCSTDMSEISETIKRIESVLQMEDKRKELSGLENQLVTQVVKLLTFFGNLNPDGNVESCFRNVLTLLMKFFSYPSHSMKVTDTQLQQLLQLLISSLVEKRQENSENWMTLQKVINNLVLKVLERSEHSMVISALLQMLYESVASSNTDQYYQELIMKCIWKTIKYIPEWDAELDYNKVLCEIYRFMNDFPNSWWKRQPNDTPMRTYKTLVHAIVTARGSDILMTVNFIPGFSQQSELYHYINKLLRHMKLEEKTDDAPDKTKYHMPRVQHEELAQILKKIGNNEETQQGLRMLYEFKKNYPEIDINQFLSKTSPYFQRYVSKGLQAVQAEKETQLLQDNYINSSEKFSDHNSSDSNDNTLDADNGAGESLELDAQRYQQKLKALKMRAGWDQHKKPGGTPAMNSEQPSNLIPTLRITSPPQKHFGDAEGDSSSLEQIRRKLSQIRGGN